METKQCLFCWTAFTTENPKKVFCSKNCVVKSHLAKVEEKQCEFCWKKFEWNKSTHYCSPECKKEGKKKKTKKTNLRKYWTENVFQSELVKGKIKETMKQKYWVEYAWQAKEIKEKIKESNLKKFWVTTPLKVKELREQGKQTMIDKYWVERPSQSQELKEKIKRSVLKRYWTEYVGQAEEIKEKMKETNIKKFWTPYASQSKEIKEKMKATTISHYWVPYSFQNDGVRKKARKTMKEKYGVEYPQQSAEIRKKSSETIFKKSWVKRNCQREECIDASCSNSEENKKFRDFLRANWIKWIENDKELSIENYRYDIPIWQTKTLIEISPRPFHNLTRHKYDKSIESNCKRLEDLQRKARDKTITKEEKKEKSEILKWRRTQENYHKDKTICARENGYRCITVFSWDDKEKIIYLLEDNKEKIYARKCEVRQITYGEAHQLFEAYHLQGDTQKNKNNLYIGLIYEWKLVMAISFWKPRYNKDYEWEILRLCTHKDYSIIWGASKIFKYFIGLANPDNVISYCDMGKFDWKVYEQMGFELLQWNFPSRHRWFRWMTNPEKKKLEKELWYEIFIPNDKHIHFTDNQINLARGFDQLLWKYFGVFGKWTRNDELLRKFNYVEVYDCWQATYIRHKEKEEK